MSVSFVNDAGQFRRTRNHTTSVLDLLIEIVFLETSGILTLPVDTIAIRVVCCQCWWQLSVEVRRSRWIMKIWLVGLLCWVQFVVVIYHVIFDVSVVNNIVSGKYNL
jgi:hypothetical protein